MIRTVGSRRPSRSGGPGQSLTLWQRERWSPAVREQAKLLLVDIAVGRQLSFEAKVASGDRNLQRRRSEWVQAAKQWRVVAGGIAVGDAVCQLALARGLTAELQAGHLGAAAVDAILTALALVMDGGTRAERIVAAAEILLILPQIIEDKNLSHVRRARGLAAAIRAYRTLGWPVSVSRGLPPQLTILSLIESWAMVEAVAIRQGLVRTQIDLEKLSARIEDLLAAKPPTDDRLDTREIGQDEDNLTDLLSPNLQAGSDSGDASDSTATGDLSLVPFPAYDPNRLTESRSRIAGRYAPLKTSLPLATIPAQAEADRALTRLAAEQPNFSAVIDRIADELALGRRTASNIALQLPPFLLVGPPGVGKTRFARRLADVLGLAFGWLSLAGSSDNRELAGTARGWSTSHPAWAVEQLVQLHSANPLLLLDEVEKAGGADRNGRATSTLLAFLEPGTARVFYDECLGGPIDLSRINWILTANSLGSLPRPLRSRVIILSVQPPAPDQAPTLLATMKADIARDRGLPDPRLLPALPHEILVALSARYATHLDPRRLRGDLVRALSIAARHEEYGASTKTVN